MLPTTPEGHCGAPPEQRTIGVSPTPSLAKAARAQARAVANSWRRAATARATRVSSSGKSLGTRTSRNASTQAPRPEKMSPITRKLPRPRGSDVACRAYSGAGAAPSMSIVHNRSVDHAQERGLQLRVARQKGERVQADDIQYSGS